MTYTTTCVSGYWEIVNKHKAGSFTNWFNNTLRINCPYVFFGTQATIELVKTYRRELPTHYIELNIEDFYMNQFKDKMSTYVCDCPSKEINIIWNEKIFLIQKAKELNIFNTEYFAWIDAGVCTFRKIPPPIEPFPNIDKLSLLPKGKFIFTSSDHPEFYPDRLSNNNYHHVSGTYIIHIDLVDTFVSLYKDYCNKYIEPTKLYTDQVILTYILRDHPDIFYKLGHGYGAILDILY